MVGWGWEPQSNWSWSHSCVFYRKRTRYRAKHAEWFSWSLLVLKVITHKHHILVWTKPYSGNMPVFDMIAFLISVRSTSNDFRDCWTHQAFFDNIQHFTKPGQSIREGQKTQMKQKDTFVVIYKFWESYFFNFIKIGKWMENWLCSRETAEKLLKGNDSIAGHLQIEEWWLLPLP